MNTKELIKHFEKNNGNPLLERILKGESSFTKEAEDFYNSSFGYGFRAQDTNWRKKKEKIGKQPKELISLIEPFYDEEFPEFTSYEKGKPKLELLTYELVRKQIKKDDLSRTAIVSLILGVFGGVGWMASSWASDSKQSLMTSIGILGLSVYGFIKNNKNSRKRFKTSTYKEFSKLKNIVHYQADPFIKKYKIYEELRK